MKKIIIAFFDTIQDAADKAFLKADNHRLFIDQSLSNIGEDFLSSNKYTASIYHIECNMALCHLCDFICHLRPNYEN